MLVIHTTVPRGVLELVAASSVQIPANGLEQLAEKELRMARLKVNVSIFSLGEMERACAEKKK